MNLPLCRGYFAVVDMGPPFEVIEVGHVAAAISAVLQYVKPHDRLGWNRADARGRRHHHVMIRPIDGDGAKIVAEVAVWFDGDGQPRTYKEGEQ